MTREEAIKAVAQDWRDLAHAIRKEDRYASHVTEAKKDELLRKALEHADAVERGESFGFTTAHRVHFKMTGECVALLP